MRGGARKGAGRKSGSVAETTRKKDTITLPRECWNYLDEIGPSRGKAVEKAIVSHRRVDVSLEAQLMKANDYSKQLKDLIGDLKSDMGRRMYKAGQMACDAEYAFEEEVHERERETWAEAIEMLKNKLL